MQRYQPAERPNPNAPDGKDHMIVDYVESTILTRVFTTEAERDRWMDKLNSGRVIDLL